MNKLNLLADYYPVFKDISEIAVNRSSEDISGATICDHENVNIPKNTGYCSSEPLAMFTADILVRKCRQYGFSAFQVIILLLKNAFEGHVYLSYNLRPDQLFECGVYRVNDKQELMIHSFYEQFNQYRAGIRNGWNLFAGSEGNYDKVCFDSVVYYALANQLIRLPVSVYSAFDINQFSVLSRRNEDLIRNRFDLTILGEHLLGEYLFIENVNTAYEDRFRDHLRQLWLKEDVLMHYDRKLFFAYDLNLKTEDELDSCMYKYLVDSKLNRTTPKEKQITQSNSDIMDESELMYWIRDKNKALYRSISRNCREVHNIIDSENKYPDLYHGFLKANSIYNEQESDFSEAFLKYMRLIHLFSKVVIYRKTYLLEISERLQSEQDIHNKDLFISAENLSLTRKIMDAKLASFMIKSQTQIKCNYIADDYMAEIHTDCIHKQIEFMDQQIRNIQQEIKEVLKQNSENVIPLK